jgi:hypothetical protein
MIMGRTKRGIRKEYGRKEGRRYKDNSLRDIQLHFQWVLEQ